MKLKFILLFLLIPILSYSQDWATGNKASTATHEVIYLKSEGSAPGTIQGYGSTDYVRIGASGTTSNSLASQNDLYIKGKVEVDGILYCDGSSVYLTESCVLWLDGSSETSGMRTLHSYHQSILFPHDDNLILINYLTRGKNFDHAASTNPTIWIHSVTNPDTDNSQWLSLSHDQTDGVIGVGKGSLKLPELYKMQLHTIAAGDSVFLNFIVDAADTTLKAWNGSDWATIQDLIP